MKLNRNLNLAYCTNVHPGEDWPQTLAALETWTLKVRQHICPTAPYAIGLRLSNLASRQLQAPEALLHFKEWLDAHDCYVFTINGFPFGQFHHTRVKEKVYLPDWTSPDRLAYTKRLFDILSALLPAGMDGSVSTLPGSFKEFIRSEGQQKQIRANLRLCVEHAARLSDSLGTCLHLGLEPEPFGLFENTAETIAFFESFDSGRQRDELFSRHLGVNYDSCHFAVEFETPESAISALARHGIRLSKIHLSNALRLRASNAALAELSRFAEDVYLHQVIKQGADGTLTRFKDVDLALSAERNAPHPEAEWRVHFHVPLGTGPAGQLNTTSDHILGVLDVLRKQPGICSHLEIETYTWSVLPGPLKCLDVVDQIVSEYRWVLGQMQQRGLADAQMPGTRSA